MVGFWTLLSRYNHFCFAPTSAELQPCCTWIHTEQRAHLKTTGRWCSPGVTPSAPQQWSRFYFGASRHRRDLSLPSPLCRGLAEQLAVFPAGASEANRSVLPLLRQLTWFRSNSWPRLICTTLPKAPKALRWSCFTVIYTQIPYRKDRGKHHRESSTKE